MKKAQTQWSGAREKDKNRSIFLRALGGCSRQGAYTYPTFFRPALAHSVRSRDLVCNTALGRKIIRSKKLKRLWTNYVSLSSFPITFIILIDSVSYVWQINVWFVRRSWFEYIGFERSQQCTRHLHEQLKPWHTRQTLCLCSVL